MNLVLVIFSGFHPSGTAALSVLRESGRDGGGSGAFLRLPPLNCKSSVLRGTENTDAASDPAPVVSTASGDAAAAVRLPPVAMATSCGLQDRGARFHVDEEDILTLHGDTRTRTLLKSNISSKYFNTIKAVTSEMSTFYVSVQMWQNISTAGVTVAREMCQRG